MKITAQIARHLRDLHFGNNWTGVNFQTALEGVTWEQATTRVADFNTIAILVYHTGYYVTAMIRVLEGGPLDTKDELSFNHPPLLSAQDWEAMVAQTWANAEKLAALIEVLPDSQLEEDFTAAKYGSYYRNFQGMIEHTHYHLGQISLIKKMLGRQV